MAGKKSSSKADKEKASESAAPEAKKELPKAEPKAAPKPEPKKEAPAPEPDPPRAVPAKRVTELASAVALVTKTKYVVNRWWNLKRGEEIHAPKVVISALRNAGLVK